MFDKYYKQIKELASFNKEDILNEEFKLYGENNIKII